MNLREVLNTIELDNNVDIRTMQGDRIVVINVVTALNVLSESVLQSDVSCIGAIGQENIYIDIDYVIGE